MLPGHVSRDTGTQREFGFSRVMLVSPKPKSSSAAGSAQESTPTTAMGDFLLNLLFSYSADEKLAESLSLVTGHN